MKVSGISVIVLLSGCTLTRSVATLQPVSRSDSATGVLADGSTIEMHATETPGGLRWEANKTGALVDSATLESYTTVDHGKGAVQGLGLGLLAGIAFGAVGGLAARDDPPDSFVGLSAYDKALILGVLFGGAGGLVGLLFGAASGSHDVHVGPARGPALSPTILPGGAGAMASWSF